jgi:hypothetical protein
MIMKAFEFQTRIEPDGKLQVPPEVTAQVPKEQAVRVVLLVAEGDGDSEWADFTTGQFLNGYAESDAIYDRLSAG